MFTGEYRHSVDDKGRIAVPAKFRLQLDGGAYLARWVDACLAIFPKAEFEALAGKVGGLGDRRRIGPDVQPGAVRQRL